MRFLLILLIYSFSSALWAAEKEVFFIPGWKTGYSAREGCVAILKDIYPGVKITVKSWNSDVSWREAKKNAEEFTAVLAEELLSMNDERRRELILVGHSLGAKILLDAIMTLRDKDLKVSEIVLLGAALPYDCEDIRSLLPVSRTIFFNVCFPDDALLKLLYPMFEGNIALGSSGWAYSDRRFVEYAVPETKLSFFNHYAYIYLEQFGSFRPVALKKYRESLFPRGCAGADERDCDSGIYWKTVERRGKFRLQRHFAGSMYRIIDSDSRVLSRGREQQIKEWFAR